MYILRSCTVICNHPIYIPNLRTAIVAIADFGAMTTMDGHAVFVYYNECQWMTGDYHCINIC